MKVTDSTDNNAHKCDITLEDITEEEQNFMFLEGLKVLVKEARDGRIGEYIVLPYDPEAHSDDAKTSHTLEISEEDVDALVQIGAVSIISSAMELYTNGDI